MNVSRRRVLVGSLSLLTLAGCDRFSLGSKAPTFNSTDITGAEFARRLELPDVDGQPRTLADWKGKVTVVFFGYTQCPDVCPTTMADLAAIRKSLGADGDKLQSVFVTIDPERDKPELLSAYVGAFDPSFLGLYGDAEATARTAKEFKIIYQKQPGRTPDTYTMDHSAGTFVFDPAGRLRLYVGHGQDAELFEHDLRELLRSAQG